MERTVGSGGSEHRDDSPGGSRRTRPWRLAVSALPDDTLVGMAVRDRGDAFGALIERHIGAVHTIVNANVSNPEDRADCVQEVVARAMENLDRLRQPRRFRSWLMAIARHVAVDGVRRSAGDRRRRSDTEADDLPTGGRTPSAEMELQSLRSRVRRAVDGLPEREAVAVTLAAFHDSKPDDIGEALGVKPGNAKVIVHRGRRRLRDELTLEMVRAGGGCASLRALGARPPQELVDHAAGCERCHALARGHFSVDSR